MSRLPVLAGYFTSPRLIGDFMSVGVVGSDCLGPYGEHPLVPVHYSTDTPDQEGQER